MRGGELRGGQRNPRVRSIHFSGLTLASPASKPRARRDARRVKGRHLEDGECGLGDGARRHGDGVLGRVALVDGDDLEARGRDVEVSEPGVLQVVKVALGQSVPAEGDGELNGDTLRLFSGSD